jgi:succinoglycan biosynthesis protein ExoM
VIDTLQSIHKVEVLIVDNNALPNEQKFVEEFAKQTRYPVYYVHEPEAGVSNARNTALRVTSTHFLAFLDDDMEITSGWIDEMVKVAMVHKAGVIFGPLVAKFDDERNPYNTYLSSFYARQSKQLEDGISEEAFGTGGCLIDLQTCILPNPPFDIRLNESGGEDDMFFESLHDSGALYGWAPNAICYECVPAERTTTKYIAKRNFGFGQGPSRIAASKGLSGSRQLARHMSVGLAQSLLFGVIWYSARLAKRPSQVRYLALAARGVGKIFWFDKFKPKLYGAPSA